MTDSVRLAPSAFPPALADLDDPPQALFVRGAIPSPPAVAIVGTRAADRGAARFARELASALAAVGYAIVSGGAEGIDAAAHEGALDAGGRTLVVLPTPIERPYPAGHRRLFERVLAEGGGWVSEREPGASSRAWHFLSRNRLIAALADATVVVQAPLRSGAMSTARAALALGRPLLAAPASPWDPRSAGNARLLADGASPCTCAADVARALGVTLDAPAPARRRPRPRLGAEERAVLDALGPAPAAVDELVRRTGLGVVTVRVALVRLASRDLADQRDGGWLSVG
ncbi:MAG: DNA-processing protein DprA [Sandaracinaceae bacterium]|nr:DNA-processing protein DprA [Sandaracinaceae bacterium]